MWSDDLPPIKDQHAALRFPCLQIELWLEVDSFLLSASARSRRPDSRAPIPIPQGRVASSLEFLLVRTSPPPDIIVLLVFAYAPTRFQHLRLIRDR